MPMIPEDEIERIKREADLAAVVRARGVELKSAGHDLIGLCPFHEDKNPSLHVTPAKRLWRCVACHATGNVIQFVQRFDGVSFRHACELLKAGTLAALAGPASGAPVKKSTVPKLASPLAADADDQAALRQVLDYYHARLGGKPGRARLPEKARPRRGGGSRRSRSALSIARSACGCRTTSARRARRSASV